MKLKPWPKDAVMVVAAHAGEERREFMQSVVDAECRACGAKLRADGFSIREAEQMPARMGRPVKFFCIPCCVQHDLGMIQDLRDYRGYAKPPVASGVSKEELSGGLMEAPAA